MGFSGVIPMVVILTILFILIFIYRNNPNPLLTTSINSSKLAQKSKYYYEIFDNSSTSDFVDRLIIVYPYGWIIWNYDSELYFIQYDENCSSNYAFYKSPNNGLKNYKKLCLNDNFDEMFEYYKSLKVKTETFEIPANGKFTYVDFIRMISEKYLNLKYNDFENSNFANNNIQQLESKIYNNIITNINV